MKRIIYYGLTLFIMSCSNQNQDKKSLEQEGPITVLNETMIEDKRSYSYIDKKKEPFINGEDNYNEMILYAAGENPNIDELKKFCEGEKSKFSDGMFHIIVFFDKKENAVFPNNPVTALFIEEEPSKHIKAIYTYNKGNGYSKLDYYDKNSWESKANSININ